MKTFNPGVTALVTAVLVLAVGAASAFGKTSAIALTVSPVLQRGTQPDTATRAFAARAGLPAGTTSSRLAFISHKSYDCCGRGGPFLLYVMNADGSGKRLLTRRAGGPAWSPDGRKIAFNGTTRDGKCEIYVVNADGSGKRRLTRTAGCEFGSAWSPDGRKIAFSRGPNGDEQVYVMNADGSGQRRLTGLAANNGFLAWLPDGKLTFVSSHGPNDFEVYVINADASGQRNLSREWGLDDTVPVWSPDGQKIVFASKRDGNWELYVMNADGSGQRNLTHNAANDYLDGYGANPWSPDGRKIVFQRDRNGDGGSDHIYVINADGSGERKLTRGRRPIWSPDGQKITFTSKREDWAEIYVMNADGSGQQRLTHSPARTVNARTVNDSPAWSPPQK